MARAEIKALGTVPTPSEVPQESWESLGHFAAWIEADVSFNLEKQGELLVPDAHCFGEVGRESIVQANGKLSETVAFAMPHTIQVNYRNRMCIWDFDVLSRQTGEITGRGTDFVHLQDGTNLVFQVDTIRHETHGGQPDWAMKQLTDPYPAPAGAEVKGANDH